MKRMLVYALAVFMTTPSLFSMEPELGALAKAAAEAAEKARADTNPVTKRIPTAEELATAERLQAPQMQFLDLLERATRGDDTPAKIAQALRPYLIKQEFERYIPLAIDTLVKSSPFGDIPDAVALLDLPAANSSFLRDVQNNWLLQRGTNQWAARALHKWSDQKPLLSGEQKLLRDILFGINTTTEHIPPLIKANDAILTDVVYDIINNRGRNLSLLTFLTKAKLIDVNKPIDRLHGNSFMQESLTQVMPSPFKHGIYSNETPTIVRELIKEGGKIIESNEMDQGLLKGITLSNDPVSLSVLKILLDENETNNNIQIDIPSLITELQDPTLKVAKEFPALPAALKDAKMKLLQEYLQHKYTIPYKLQTLWGSKK